MCIMFLELISNGDAKGKWIEEPFDLKINDKDYGSFIISKNELPPIKAGDEVVFSKKISKQEYENINLVFRTYGSAIDVYVSDKYLYSYGEALYEQGRMLGRGYHIVKIQGVERFNPYLEVRIKPTEKMSYAWVDFMKFTYSNTVWRDLVKENLFALMLSFMMFFGGMIGYLASLVAYFKQKITNCYQIYAFSTVFFVGLWNICAFSFLQFMTNNYENSSILEYMSIYIAGYTYLATMEIIQKDTKYGKVIHKMKLMYAAYICISFILHVFGIIWISQTIRIYRGLMAMAIIIIAIIFLVNYERQDRYQKILSICNAVAIGLSALQMMLWNFNVTVIALAGRNLQASHVFTTVAISIVVVAPILSYTLKVMEIDKYEKQITILKDIAHKDQITGLDNRYGGIAFSLEIRKNRIPYSIIMYDLNNLKTVNDTYGHDAGDKLIKDFANCIRFTFSEDKYINVRHGGDEFITIAKISDKKILQEKVADLQLSVDNKNSSGENLWKMSFAYGIASSNETSDGNYEDILNIADVRMYENKTNLLKNNKK